MKGTNWKIKFLNGHTLEKGKERPEWRTVPKRRRDTAGEAEDLMHNLLHDGGNEHGTVGTYMKERNISTHDAGYFGETEDKFNKV